MRPAIAAVPRLRPTSAPAIFRHGFRPFFLAAGGWAVAVLVLWLCWIAGQIELPTAFAPSLWHGHEMLYGFAAAAVAGFLLTAIPNWTGRLPVCGAPLAALAATWLAGRIAVATSGLVGALPAAWIDLSFPLALLGAVTREVVAGRNWRNLPVLVAIASFFAGNVLTHLEPAGVVATAPLGLRVGIATLVLLVALIGGRIVPSFTTNWLKRQGDVALPRPFGGFDKLVLAATLPVMLAWATFPENPAVGTALIAVGLLHGTRLARWRGWRTLAEPLVAVLHLGYAWLALGLLLLGAEAAGFLPLTGAGLHALTTGAFATMILAVMTRATLGHTGRDLTVGLATTAIYALASLAAVLRIGGSMMPSLLPAAGVAWIAAFGLFVAIYGPMLVVPRPDGRPG